MRKLPLLVALMFAVPLAAQSPTDDWRTLETPHFRVHYPRPYEAWTLRAASRLESIRAAVAKETGYATETRAAIIVANPLSQANGLTFALLDRPVIVLFTEPDVPDDQLGEFTEWVDLLTVHEMTHLVHLVRPSRNPMRRLLEVLLPFGPLSFAPRWVNEGYATMIEGRLTGSGRPSSTFRAAVLRKWAETGQLPTYEELDSDQRFLGMSMAYLAGSAFLEWLVEKTGPDSLRNLWARMTARQRRSFDSAFAGVIPRQRQLHVSAKVIQQELHIARTAFDVLLRIEDVRHAKACGRSRHQLHQSARTRRTDDLTVELAFLPRNGVDHGPLPLVRGRHR